MCDKGCGAWLGSLGLEPTPEMYVDHLVQVFREIWQVLRDDGTVWLNLGDTYAGGGNNAGNTRSIAHTKTATNRGNRYVKKPVPEGMKGGDLVGIPWMVAFALRADGWYLRRDIIWWKRNGLPESARTRPSGAHEYFFLLTKTRKPFYDNEAVKVPAVTEGYTRQLRSVWDFPTQSFKGTHYATFNPRLIEPCVLAGTSEKGCCPECGAPWIRVVTKQNARLTDRQNNNAFKHDAATSHGEGATTLRVSADSTTVGWQPGCEHTEEYGGKSREQDPHANSRRIVARAKEARDAGGHHDNPFLPTETVGWEQGCAHPLEPVPCTVLDPFGGAGTTLLTALALRRNAITTELSPKYAAMIRSRVTEREYLKIRRKLSQHRENRAKEHCSTCSCYVPDEILATGEEL
jgi:DNA modification methylase